MPSPHNSRKYSFTILFFVIIMESMYPLTPLPGGNAPAQEGSISERYEKRCGQLFAYADSTKEPNYFIAAAKLNRKTDSATGLKMIEELLSEPTASARGMFVIYELMAAYLYGFDEIPPELKSKIWESFRTRPLYRGDTENHWVMYYTGLYLAAQTWKGYNGDFWSERRGRLAVLVVAPAGERPVGPQAAVVAGAGRYQGESARAAVALAVGVPPPAGDRPVEA